MTSSAPTTIRQRLDALKPQVLAVATRHGASNLKPGDEFEIKLGRKPIKLIPLGSTDDEA